MANVVDTANQVLQYLSEQVDRDWSQRLSQELTSEEMAQTMKRIGDIEPVGVFAQGTAALRNAAGIDGEDAQQAIRLLVDEHRILQIGRGRGKAIILLSDDPVSGEHTRPARPVRSAGRSDMGNAPASTSDGARLSASVPDTLRQIKDAWVALVAERDALRSEVAALRTRVGELERLSELSRASSW